MKDFITLKGYENLPESNTRRGFLRNVVYGVYEFSNGLFGFPYFRCTLGTRENGKKFIIPRENEHIFDFLLELSPSDERFTLLESRYPLLKVISEDFEENQAVGVRALKIRYTKDYLFEQYVRSFERERNVFKINHLRETKEILHKLNDESYLNVELEKLLQ